LLEFAEACAVPRHVTHRTNGSQSDAITYGIRWQEVRVLAEDPLADRV
jgi:hypothetical protein